MKKLVVFFTTLALLIVVKGVSAEEIQSFKTDLTVQKNGQVHVVETIVYTFTSEKHGIYRDIPFIKKNKEGKEYKLDIVVNDVTDESGRSYTYKKQTVGDVIQLKIGDADTLLTGEHTYIIDYLVSGALTYFTDHDELSWNATGNAWTVPIQSATTTITYPIEIPTELVKNVCATGPQGSTKQNCTINIEKNTITIQTNLPLNPQEGMSVAASFPKGHLAVLEPTSYTRWENTWYGQLISLLILFALGVGTFIWYLGLPAYIVYRWFRYGRDPKVQSVRVWYDPPKAKDGRTLTAAETGALIDETVDARDIFSAIIQLAQKGYLQIEEKTKGQFVLHKKKEGGTGLTAYELRLYNALFKDRESLVLKGADLSMGIADVTRLLYQQLVTDGYFTKSPQATRTKYYVLAGVAFFTGNLFLAVVAFLFGKNMPQKTLLGAEAASTAQSLKTFLTSQDRQLAFQAQNQMMFEKLLPYAVAFGVEKIWADRFKNIALQSPTWYTGYGNGTFQTYVFASAIHNSMGTFSATMTTTRSSSGFSSSFSGGFSSGGGGGGGGGGSW